MDKGYVQVYTGSGKGKTTAAFGLALRSVGAGFKVFIGQFAKGMHYSELDSLKRFEDQVTVRQYGGQCFIYNHPRADDVLLARFGLDEMRRVLTAGKHQLVVMDEANVATFFKLFTVEELLEVIDAKPPHVELVITGRWADERVIARADLVTEMREVKHYYATQGVLARVGIES